MSQQSQCGFIEEVMAWDKQMCLDNLDEALPKIISKMEESANIEESIGVLKIICHSFLPCVPAEQLENRLFSQVCKLACSFIDRALCKIEVNVKGIVEDSADKVKSVVMECLEWIMDTASCIECFVNHVLNMSTSVELSSIQSLPICALHVLRHAYTHCRDSTGLYGDLLEHIGEPLSQLFKRTHSMQMTLVKLLDKICITGSLLEEHVQTLCSVCTGLFEICRIVTSLDVKLVISLWKGIVKICSQHINLLRDRFEVCPLINLLSDEITQGYKYLFDLCPKADPESLSQGDDAMFSKSCRILGFQMKVMLALLRDFQNYLGNCESNVLDMLLFLHRYLPPSLSAREIPAKLECDVRSHVLNATSTIIEYLVGSRVFRSKLTSCCEERAPDDRLPQLLIQLMVLDILPKCQAEVVGHWLIPARDSSHTPSVGLLYSLFNSIKQCEVEMRLPVMLSGIMVAGKPHRQVSLFEHVVTHICGFIGACPAQHFTILENTLLENVLGDNDLAYVLAVDCWCFLVRYGIADMCKNQVEALMLAFKQLHKTNQKSSHKILHLIQRLIKFMAAEHQSELVKQFSPDTEPELWIALTPACLNDDLASSVRQKLVSWGLSILQGTQGKALHVLNACKLFVDLLSGGSPVTDYMSLQQQLLLLDCLCKIWSHIQSTPLECNPMKEHLLVRLLSVTECLLPLMEAGEMVKVLGDVQTSISNMNIALSMVHLLSVFGAQRKSLVFQQPQVLNQLYFTFCALMTHPNPLVQHHAFEAYVLFASHRDHDKPVPDYIQSNEILNNRVRLFQNKVSYQPIQRDFVLVNYLKSQVSEAVRWKKRDNTSTHDKTRMNDGNQCKKPEATILADTEMDVTSNNQPVKRARLSIKSPDSATVPQDMDVNTELLAQTLTSESTETSKYQTILDTLSTCARDIELESSRSALPLWFVDAARVMVTKMRDCLSANNSSWFDSLS